VPVVNTFDQIAEPIRVSETESEYRVVIDGRRQDATEVYSVDSVVSVSPDEPEPLVYRPFYSFKHEMDQAQQRTFWTPRAARPTGKATRAPRSTCRCGPGLQALETGRRHPDRPRDVTNRDLPPGCVRRRARPARSWRAPRCPGSCA